MIWHSSEITEVLKELSVDENKGLANGVADMRLEQYGPNKISNIENPTFLRRFLTQLNNRYVYLLVVIALLSFVLSLVYKSGDYYSPLLIILIVVANAFISALNLYRSDNALNSIKSISSPQATVLRDGITQQISSDELVVGDIILLKEGDYITADARIIEENGLRCNESVITGESVPAEKRADSVVEDITPIDKRINMVYSGCSVVHGTAKAVVVETGLNTEIGRTSAIIQQTGADKLPLQNTLDEAGRIVNIVVIAVCVIFFALGLVHNFTVKPFAAVTVKTLLQSVALAVAAIPEGLPAISTIVIALGIQRIIKENIIIKKTDALENLGKTTVICTDKTGILTRNKMELSFIFDGDKLTDLKNETPDEKTSMVLSLATACTTLDNDATERAIERACIDINSRSLVDIEHLFPRMGTIPFDLERKTMTTVNMVNGHPVAIVKGAPEIVVEKCVGCDKDAILKLNDELAAKALRMLCIAVRPLDEIPSDPTPELVEHDLTFVGLLGLLDPPRPEAVSGIECCDGAGIRTVMITGDNFITAKAVAEEMGILKEGTMAITGAELAEMSDEELAENIEKYSVFARVSEGDKLRILAAWQSRGEVVAVTGDSIADQEALAAADIGCAIGSAGADVAKGSADIIISSNSFSCVVDAIRESRGMFDNIRKSVSYLLSCNMAEVLVFLITMIFMGKAPIAAVQLLWINLLTDCAPAISLSMERAEPSVMRGRKSFLTGVRLFDGACALNIALQAVFIAVITLVAFLIGGNTFGTTMAFMTLGIAQILHAYNIRTSGSIVLSNPLANKFMTYSTIITLFVILFLVFTPAGFVFGLTIPSFWQFAVSLGLAVLIVPFCELTKLVFTKAWTVKN